MWGIMEINEFVRFVNVYVEVGYDLLELVKWVNCIVDKLWLVMLEVFKDLV